MQEVKESDLWKTPRWGSHSTFIIEKIAIWLLIALNIIILILLLFRLFK